MAKSVDSVLKGVRKAITDLGKVQSAYSASADRANDLAQRYENQAKAEAAEAERAERVRARLEELIG